MARNLSRDARLFVATAGEVLEATTGITGFANVWEIPILDGFSFTQDNGTQDITVEEAGANPTRGMKQFNTTLNPVDVSFSCYVKPYIKVNEVGAVTAARASSVETILWNSLISKTLGTVSSAGGVTTGASDVLLSGIVTSFSGGTGPSDFTDADMTLDFSNSEEHELLKLDLYFNFENTTYKVADFNIGSVEIDFSIDGIATLNWAGMGLTLEDSDADHTIINGWLSSDANKTYTAAPVGTLGCIKNRFTTMTLQDGNGGLTDTDWYSVAITGGSITIENNITYLIPEELGKVNTACGSFTGTRSISGNVTAYLNTGAGTGADSGDNAKTTAQLLDDILALTDSTSTSYALTLYMGGISTDTPIVTFNMPTAHLTIPTVNTDDVIATEINFVAQGSLGLESTDELTVTYTHDVTVQVDDTP